MKEENKSIRNVTNTSEVELQPEPRDRKASRNTWAENYRETTALRKSTILLGQVVEIDDGLEWRVKWGQRGVALSAFFIVILWFVELYIATLVFSALLLVFAVLLYYKNVSFVIAKRLLPEPNVVVIIVLALCNWSIDITRPATSFSSVNGLFYLLGVSLFVFIDAVKVKSRVFGIAVGVLFVSLNMANIYYLIFTDWDQGIILLNYSIQGNKYNFMKRSIQRSIYIQIMLFSMNGVYTLFKDRKQELMIFATGQIYRETGKAQENATEDGNARITTEPEIQPKTKDRKASRNSWVDIYNEATALRQHEMLLGQEVQIDDGLEWRVKWSQRGGGVSTLLVLICYVAGQFIALILFAAIGLIFFGILYYKNVSFVISKRLLRETNVVMILVFGLCIWVINIAEPAHSLEPVLGLVYMLNVSIFVFVDALKVKNRVFGIAVGVIFVFGNIYFIYQRIFGGTDQGIVLFKYTIQGNKYTFMKRSVKLSIFIQIMLFSMSGIYTLFKDRKQELLIFATGNIYRETGTASKEVEQKSFVRKVELEKKMLSV